MVNIADVAATASSGLSFFCAAAAEAASANTDEAVLFCHAMLLIGIHWHTLTQIDTHSSASAAQYMRKLAEVSANLV